MESMFASEIERSELRTAQAQLDRAVWLDASDAVEVCSECECQYVGEHRAICSLVSFQVAA